MYSRHALRDDPKTHIICANSLKCSLIKSALLCTMCVCVSFRNNCRVCVCVCICLLANLIMRQSTRTPFAASGLKDAARARRPSIGPRALSRSVAVKNKYINKPPLRCTPPTHTHTHTRARRLRAFSDALHRAIFPPSTRVY